MKRKISRLLTLALSGAFVFSVQTSDACTNFLVTKGASTDGSTFVTYAADSHYLYGELYFRPAMDYPAGTLQKIYEWDTGKFLGEIPQVAH
ncbi:MAG TPA: C69 family dipeptidase, partial [Tenuifilaceae bacterium]|nr:C69 family dipeptidase [Tenuifilaceae bacterium]